MKSYDITESRMNGNMANTADKSKDVSEMH